MTLSARITRNTTERLFKTDVSRAARLAMERMATDIVRDMKARTPVRTGTLRDSIHHSWDGETLRLQTGEEAPYAQFVEFGTSRMVASPFFFPVLDEYRSRFPEYVRAAIKEVIG